MECSDEDETNGCLEFNVSEPADQNQQPLSHLPNQILYNQPPNQLLPDQQLIGQYVHNQLIENPFVSSSQLVHPHLAHGQLAQSSQVDPQIIELSLKFGEWFYSVLPKINRGAFSVNNFWEDSLIAVQFEYNGRAMSLTESGAARNVELLRKLISCNLRFKPNLLPQHDGVRAEMESHGLLKSTIAGILYAGDEPIGWFEHLFGLIAESNLHEHRWRIKTIQMKLKLSKPILSLETFITEHQHQIQ